MPLKRAGIALVYCLFDCKCLRVILESALESVATNKTIQYGGLGEYTWLDLLFKLYEWPSQTVHFTPERNSDYLRAFDKKNRAQN